MHVVSIYDIMMSCQISRSRIRGSQDRGFSRTRVLPYVCPRTRKKHAKHQKKRDFRVRRGSYVLRPWDKGKVRFSEKSRKHSIFRKTGTFFVNNALSGQLKGSAQVPRGRSEVENRASQTSGSGQIWSNMGAETVLGRVPKVTFRT